MIDQEPRRPQLGDPDYNISAFGRDLFGGRLRWLATILAIASAGLIVCIFAGLLPAEMDFPFRLNGTTTKVVLVAAMLIWSVIAAANWMAWLKLRKAGRH